MGGRSRQAGHYAATTSGAIPGRGVRNMHQGAGVAGSQRAGCRALVLGGGGAFGSVQAAYVAAAAEAGFAADVVVGTSVGALNAAWVAMYPGDVTGLLDIWRTLNGRKVVDLCLPAMLRRLIRRPLGIAANTLVLELVEQYIGTCSFSDTRLPLAVTATNLSRGRKQVFQTGMLADAILASTAVPGLFAPIELRGELFVDGSLVAATDLATAVEMGATEILAIDLTPAPSAKQPRTPLDVLRRSLGIIGSSATAAMEDCLRLRMPVSIVRPDLAQLSAWRVATSRAAVDGYLAVARRTLADVIDSDGHLLPVDGAMNSCDGTPRSSIAAVAAIT